MKILLVEDDQFKHELLGQVMREFCPTPLIDVARSVQQAVRFIRAATYNLIVLDIALPSHVSRRGGAQPISQPSGGIEVLLELSYEGRADKVVIVTQYPEIEYDGKLYALRDAGRVLVRTLAITLLDVIHFRPRDSAWRDQLGKALKCV